MSDQSGTNLLTGALFIFGLFYFFGNQEEKRRPYTGERVTENEIGILSANDQLTFVSIVTHAKNQFREEDNAVRQGEIRRVRGQELCTELRSAKFEQWQGVVSGMETTSDGVNLNRIYIQVAEGITLVDREKYGRRTYQHSKFLNDIQIGDRVLFSGKFGYDFDERASDCFLEDRLSMSGRMTSPNFVFSLGTIEKFD